MDALVSDFPILSRKGGGPERVSVELPKHLRKYVLRAAPGPTELRTAAFRLEQLRLLDRAGAMSLAFASLVFALITKPRWAVLMHGETGSMKTAAALLLQNCVAPGAGEGDTVSLKSTENAMLAHLQDARNVVTVLDDYIPISVGGDADVSRKTDGVVRSAVNAAAKSRCKPDGTLREAPEPEGLVLLTAEAPPDGLDSLSQRTLSLPFDEETFKAATSGSPNRFDQLQRAGERGELSAGIFGLIAYMAGRLPGIYVQVTDVRNPKNDVLDVPGSLHRRQRDMGVQLADATDVYLQFLVDMGFLTEGTRRKRWERFYHDVFRVWDRAATAALLDRPDEYFASLLRGALYGGVAHIDCDGNPREAFDGRVEPELLGYRESRQPTANPGDDGASSHQTVLTPRGFPVGWTDGEAVCLDPEVTIAAANTMARKMGAKPVENRPKWLGKVLRRGGWLSKSDIDRNCMRVTIGGTKRRLWCVDRFRLFEQKLDWGDFHVGCYDSMLRSGREKSRREAMEKKLRLHEARASEYGWKTAVLSLTDEEALPAEDLDPYDLMPPPPVGPPPVEEHEVMKRPWSWGSALIPGYDHPDVLCADDEVLGWL